MSLSYVHTAGTCCQSQALFGSWVQVFVRMWNWLEDTFCRFISMVIFKKWIMLLLLVDMIAFGFWLWFGLRCYYFIYLHGVCALIVVSYWPYPITALLCARFTSSLQSSVLCSYLRDELAPFSPSSQILTKGRTWTILVNFNSDYSVLSWYQRC